MLATASLFDHVHCQIAALLEIGRLGYQDRHTVFGFKFQRFKPLYQAGKPYGFFGGRAGATSLHLGRAGAASPQGVAGNENYFRHLLASVEKKAYLCAQNTNL